MPTLAKLRRNYHEQIGSQIVRVTGSGGGAYPNFADGSSRTSVRLAKGIMAMLGFSKTNASRITGQTAGNLFEKLTCEFVESAFTAIEHLRPGRWQYMTVQTRISNFVQYQHLGTLESLVSQDRSLSTALGHGYIVTPDIVITPQSCH